VVVVFALADGSWRAIGVKEWLGITYDPTSMQVVDGEPRLIPR
jgi:hypothetical protein